MSLNNLKNKLNRLNNIFKGEGENNTIMNWSSIIISISIDILFNIDRCRICTTEIIKINEIF